MSEGKLQGKLEKMDKSPFFVLSKPYTEFIGKGKIFSFVYFIMAAINLVIPFAVIYKTIDSGIFRNISAKYVFAIIFAWLVIAFACWIGFQIWWIRRIKLTDTASFEFIATTSFSEILQTFGEWLGTLIGIIGTGVGLIALIILGNETSSLFSMLGLSFMNFGPLVIIIGPITGFFIIILFRFFGGTVTLICFTCQ